ncbi:hypothetical protein SSS_05082 [Sarcoptes scabiei]|nr:hypothetical protein SSS_05082 [Sarcoptes scabiei]
MSDWIDDDTIDHIAPMLYRGRPCSYHYTKSLAEHLLAQEVINGFYSRRVITNKNYEDDCKDEDEDGDVKWRPFPAAIVRPSIITPSWRDPIPGWIDNYNGTTGFMVVLGKGVLRSMHVHKDYLCDLIPVDVVINTCILSAWYASTVYYSQQTFPKTLTIQSTESSTRNSDVFVVNCVSGPSNPITWDEIRRIATPLMFRYPSEEIFRVPFVRYHRSKYLNQLNVLLEHTVPAAIIDFVFKFFGLTPILNQVYEKVHRSTSALEFFTTNEWTFVSDNMQILSNELNRSYREHRCNSKCSKHHQRIQSARESIDERFSIDLRRLIWKDYFKHYVLGIRKYLLKEDPGTISKAHNQMMILYTVTMMTKIILTGTILYQIVNPRSMIRESLRMFIGAKHQSKLLRQSSQSTSSLPSLLSSQSLMMKNFLQEIRNRSPLAMFTVQ